MTDDEMRVKIAGIAGPWTFEPSTNEFNAKPYVLIKFSGETQMRYYPDEPDGISRCLDLAGVPDYPQDLNAMHEAEKVLTAEQADKYFTKLMFREGGIGEPHWVYPDGTAYGRGARYSHSAHATARQRAEAFLLTIA